MYVVFKAGLKYFILKSFLLSYILFSRKRVHSVSLQASVNLSVFIVWNLSLLQTEECQPPFASIRIRSLTTAVTDLQHTLKGVQGGDQE